MQLFGPDFKGELQRLIEEQGVKAVIMGNRVSDPYSQQLSPIEKSSPGWPEFTRVFPVLAWDYASVWQFLRAFELPYCCLYDQGYTSLGEKHNSRPNPHLLKSEGQYCPAYELADPALERLSRC